MTSKRLILFIASFVLLTFVKAQNKNTDSAAVIATFKSILAACKEDNTNDPQLKTLGRYYKAASYVVYRGIDKKRAWKEFVNYAAADEKELTDGICKRINRSVNLDKHYIIERYFTEKEYEGTWHVLIIKYKTADGKESKAAMAFLKVGDKFGLGDVDEYSKD